MKLHIYDLTETYKCLPSNWTETRTCHWFYIRMFVESIRLMLRHIIVGRKK